MCRRWPRRCRRRSTRRRAATIAGLVGLNATFVVAQGRRGSAMGMHFSVVCAEDVPRLGDSARQARAPTSAASSRASTSASAPPGRAATCRPAFYGVVAERGAGAAAERRHRSGDAAAPRRARRRARSGRWPATSSSPTPATACSAIGCMRDVVFRFIDAADDRDALAVDAGCATVVPRPPAFRPITLPRAASPRSWRDDRSPLSPSRSPRRRRSATPAALAVARAASARKRRGAPARRPRRSRRQLRRAGRPHHRPARPERRRQDDDAAHARRR